MKIKKLKTLLTLVIVSLSFFSTNSIARNTASANSKYNNLIQELTCPTDVNQYGEYHDYGYWAGGSWCGQQGRAGYWVWLNPTWYVWANKEVMNKSSANGRYSNLLQTLNCPKDQAQYGSYRDYGYWRGGSWCGQIGKAGYWVWVAPNWYVWGNKK